MSPEAELVEAVVKGIIITPVTTMIYGLALGAIGMAIPPAKDEGAAITYASWATKRLDADTLTSAKFRGLIKPEEYAPSMKELGFNETRSKQFLGTRHFIPAMPDAIRWAVREAFDDKYAEEHNMDSHYPDQLSNYAELAGVDPSEDNQLTIMAGTPDTPISTKVPREAAYYWRSHWVLPSIRQAFEMYHRGEITREKMIDLMRVQDVMPVWHDPLAAIAFSVPTRIDIRRMYRMGVVTIEDVFDTYKKLGYSWYCSKCGEEISEFPSYCKKCKKFTDAGALTEFVRVYYGEEKKEKTVKERDLTKSEILKAYKLKQISKADATDGLKDLGYDEEEAEFLTALYEIQESSAKRDLSRSLIENIYRYGIIDKDEARTRMTQLDYTAESADYILELIDYKKGADGRPLPYATARGLFYFGMIKEDNYLNRLVGLGYIPEDAALIMQYDIQRMPIKYKKELGYAE